VRFNAPVQPSYGSLSSFLETVRIVVGRVHHVVQLHHDVGANRGLPNDAKNCKKLWRKKTQLFVRYSASLFWQTIFGGLFFHNTHKLHVYCLFVVLKLTSVDKAL
jgi:hypothetical protein